MNIFTQQISSNNPIFLRESEEMSLPFSDECSSVSNETTRDVDRK